MKIRVGLILALCCLSTAALANDAGKYIKAGNAKIEAGDYAGALGDFNQAVELAP